MWIKGSTLSTSQRSLLPELPLSPVQAQAQELATQLIQSYSARHATNEALEFIREHARIEPGERDNFIRVTCRALPHTVLPPSYGLKGGAARESLIAALTIRESRQPRDLDIVRRGHHHTPSDDDVARRFMARDYQLGARVELIRDISDYLTSRDLTINEVAWFDGIAHASLLCILDSIGHVIRPSRYRGGTLHKRPSLHGQSLLKMIRLYAEGSFNGENWTITGIPEEVAFSEFDLAVHLNKAFQRDQTVADRFLHTCELLSLIGASEARVRTALQELEHFRHGEQGLFPDVPADEWSFLKHGPTLTGERLTCE
jgi:hypothetical protein